MARSSSSCLVLTAGISRGKESLFPDSFSDSLGESSGLIGWVQIPTPKQIRGMKHAGQPFLGCFLTLELEVRGRLRWRTASYSG